MGKNTKIVGGVLLITIILVAVAYAAITNVELNINGVGNAQAKQEMEANITEGKERQEHE